MVPCGVQGLQGLAVMQIGGCSLAPPHLLFLHLLFIYLQGDSLQTEQVIGHLFSFFLFCLPLLHLSEGPWISGLSTSPKPCKCRSSTSLSCRFDIRSVSKAHSGHFDLSRPCKSSLSDTERVWRARETTNDRNSALIRKRRVNDGTT